MLLTCITFIALAAPVHGIKTELVMTPGMVITAKTKSGVIKIEAISKLGRSYTWEGATRSVELIPRQEKWYGSLGAYFPGPGDHWREHNGITRGVLEEAQRHFESQAEAMKWIKDQAWMPYVYRNDGLFVSWGKVLERRQLNVDVAQIYIDGTKPTHLPGSNDDAISVHREPVQTPKNSLASAVRAHDSHTVRIMLAKGSSPDARDAMGKPALVIAAQKGYSGEVGMLLEAGADANIRASDAEAATALLVSSSAEITQMLLDHHADPNLGYSGGMLEGMTPLIAAAMNEDNKSALLLLAAGADPSLGTADGQTVMHWAASKANLPLLRILINRKVAVDPRNQLGVTPLMEAVMDGNQRQDRIETVKLLIEAGANVNARMDETARAYWRAAFVGDKKAMERIEKSGELAKPHENGPSILDMAEDEEIRAILKAAGAKSAPPPKS